MAYEINVAKNGRHFFATAERSCTSEYDARRVFVELQQRFPEAEGFNVSCTYWEKAGYKVELTVDGLQRK